MFSDLLREAARRLQKYLGIRIYEDPDLVEAVLDAHADVKSASVFTQFDLIVKIDAAAGDRFELSAGHGELGIRGFQLFNPQDQANDGAVKLQLGGEDYLLSQFRGVHPWIVLQKVGVNGQAFREMLDLFSKGAFMQAGLSRVERESFRQGPALSLRKKKQGF